jgi:diacylglycerol kinase
MIEGATGSGASRGLVATPEPDDLAGEYDPPGHWSARAGRRNSGEKFAAGLRGLKHAIRGDSSFFAHGYRGILIALTAAMLGVSPWAWCLLVIAACLVLLSELTHSAVDTLARAVGDPEDPPLRMAREIAAACVLVAAFFSGAVTIIVLTMKFGELLGW